MFGSLLGDPQWTAAERPSLRKYGAGPEQPVRRFADYLQTDRGRRRPGRGLLAGACFQQAFFRHSAAIPVPDATVTALSATLLRALGGG